MGRSHTNSNKNGFIVAYIFISLPGNFYITRHSNLSQVHVVFHLVVDDSLKEPTLATRNAIVSGLRNVLHTASRQNVHTITLPVLLAEEMTEVCIMYNFRPNQEHCEKCNYKFSGRNRTCSHAVPVKRSNQLSYTAESRVHAVVKLQPHANCCIYTGGRLFKGGLALTLC
jgi:hypothetical protein